MLQAEEDLLVIAAQRGNHKAFETLVLMYQQPLFRFAFKISNDHEIACDAVQDAWIKATKNLRQLNDPRAFKSWIYRLVKWRVTDLLRVQVKHSSRFDNEASENLAVESPAAADGQSELIQAINRLPALEKQMIHLFYLDEMKITDVAIILDIPAGTVKSRLNRARKLLQQKFI